MFTIIYNLQTGRIKNIVAGKSNEENLTKAIDLNAYGYMFAESLPPITDCSKEELRVVDGRLKVFKK